MATSRDFRRMALAMKGALEGAHMGHPDFRANGRIFATLQTAGDTGMVKLTADDQRRIIAEHPEAFRPAAGAWGLQGATLVTLALVSEDVLGEAMTRAWQENTRAAAAKPGKRVPRSS